MTLQLRTIANPISDSTRSFTWQHGRQLASMTKNGVTWTYTYNSDGLRTKRTNGTATYEYVYNGSQLTQMKYNGNAVDLTYDADGRPLTLTYQGVTYYYVTNVQGDVVGITDAAGNLLISFKYEAYGSGYYTSHNAEKAALLAQINPLGYRGYVLDVGTQLYYLQSRYYDPELGRFVNADGQISDVGGDLLGNNQFAYCFNNPINMEDTSGNWPTWNDIISAGKEIVDMMVHALAFWVSPLGSTVFKEAHYSRNKFNNSNYTEKELLEQGYTKEPTSSDKFHQNNQKNNERNRKYVIGEWCSSEIVYYSDGTINDTPEDEGTFNVYSGDNLVLNIGVHGYFDVLPYMVWGNSRDDTTTIIDRFIMIWE